MYMQNSFIAKANVFPDSLNTLNLQGDIYLWVFK